MSVRLSRRELAALSASRLQGTPRAPRERTPYHTRCARCGEEFVTMAAETRHMDDTGHRRFQLVLQR